MSKKYAYAIVFHGSYGPEEVDSFDTMKEAQAMLGEGTITFKTRIARQVTIGRVRHRLALDLHVIDNGPGVPLDLRESIFYPLVTGRAGGSGLGLSMAQSLVQQHGGIIEFDSKPGETDFKVRLPLIGGKKR